MKGEKQCEGTNHRPSHLVAIRFQVELVQRSLDALSGGVCSFGKQHMEVTHKILRDQKRRGRRNYI